ncbi:hypothetical protein A2943_02245 [Candidatus Adlerbacteria bacterium RIFCSPLOWO2_01_FULL_51_16]|uniref:Type II secretion system protein GspI C-terminal domain-containing protein n=1 Tax=Candidatus Adlerbacteria bacterium RIFCSPLOWO2_01_FULL_51_16 TaxID=1797243 RepID=A0A1F4XG96_9BACT|nr:MAG: hypothetical protein A2943_02245 [Candidatus Adlerbacteria bacterium RIFCSPLOWO2_01_FULL_51_16]
MISSFKKIIKQSRGFTLVETLVAVLLLTTAIVGPITIASKGLTASVVAKDQITAFFLAQDAVENVRFIRESNRLGGYAWLAGLDGSPNGGLTTGDATCQSNNCCVDSNGSRSCYMDSRLGTVASCAGTCSTPLRYDATNGYFLTTGGGSPTAQNFRRTVKIINNPGGSTPNEATVIVTVTWNYNIASGITRSVEVRETLFNWQ